MKWMQIWVVVLVVLIAAASTTSYPPLVYAALAWYLVGFATVTEDARRTWWRHAWSLYDRRQWKSKRMQNLAPWLFAKRMGPVSRYVEVCPTCQQAGPDHLDSAGTYGGERELRCGDPWHKECVVT